MPHRRSLPYDGLTGAFTEQRRATARRFLSDALLVFLPRSLTGCVVFLRLRFPAGASVRLRGLGVRSLVGLARQGCGEAVFCVSAGGRQGQLEALVPTRISIHPITVNGPLYQWRISHSNWSVHPRINRGQAGTSPPQGFSLASSRILAAGMSEGMASNDAFRPTVLKRILAYLWPGIVTAPSVWRCSDCSCTSCRVNPP